MSTNLAIDMLLREAIVSIKEASRIRFNENRLQVHELMELEKIEAELVHDLLEKLKNNVGRF
jgi:hypothetical protein